MADTPQLCWRLILNGKCAGDDPLREAVKTMRARGIRLSVRVSWEEGDAERYVNEAIEDGVDTIIAAGGDGTLSAVATVLAHRDTDADALPSIGVLALGTANDFATAAQIPVPALEAFELIHAVAAQPIDLLKLVANDDTHWAANLASGGFGTDVTVETSDGLKKMLGGLAYLITGMSKLGRIDPIQARITGDDFAWEGGFIALGIGNGKQAGGGQALCPDALIDDGLLDCTIVPELQGEVGATIGTLITEGKEAALDRVAVRKQLRWVTIDALEPLTLNLDGEPVESRRFCIECVPKRVRMHLPDGCPLLGPSSSRRRQDQELPPDGGSLLFRQK